MCKGKVTLISKAVGAYFCRLFNVGIYSSTVCIDLTVAKFSINYHSLYFHNIHVT